MPRRERGASPAGFRTQLLAHLRNQALRDGVAVQRLQQRVAFERFLARLELSGDWVLKGGFALELRYGWSSRPTRDIDLYVVVDVRTAVEMIRFVVGESTVDDHFGFEFGAAVQELQGAPGGTLRVPVLARLAGDVFANFHIDVSSGDALLQVPDTLQGSNLLGYTGIPSVQIRAYPVGQHLAEKLHAYTLPRSQTNTRVKDFADLVTLAAVEIVDGGDLRACMIATFETRHSYPIPTRLPEPPAEWAGPFARLASMGHGLPAGDLSTTFALLSRFWTPVLGNLVEQREWHPTRMQWLPKG